MSADYGIASTIYLPQNSSFQGGKLSSRKTQQNALKLGQAQIPVSEN
jgi:hypothetical protein